MNAMRVTSALILSFCCWPCFTGCSRVREPIGHTDGGVQDGGGPMSVAGSNSTGRAGKPGDDGGSGRAGSVAAGAGRAGDEGPREPYGGASGWRSAAGSAGNAGFEATGRAGYGGQHAVPQGGYAGIYVVGVGGTCSCDDGDLCTDDYCSPSGCLHMTRVTDDVDSDEDGFYRGCDCDDSNADVHPGQTAFFSDGHAGAPDGMPPLFDYDCNWLADQRFISLSSECEPYPGTEACFGEGWLNVRWPPECGQDAHYQLCEFKDGMCTPQTVNLVQRCR